MQVEDEWIFFTYPPGVYSAPEGMAGPAGGGGVGGGARGAAGGGAGGSGGARARARDDMDASLDVLTASGDPDRERTGKWERRSADLIFGCMQCPRYCTIGVAELA